MKQAFSGLLLMMLCVGLLSFTVRIQPTRAETPTPLSVSVTPFCAVLSGGQSQLFNSTVTGGSPPYSYQWFNYGASPISGETNSTYSWTAPLKGEYDNYISVRVTDSVGTIAWSGFAWEWEPVWDAPVYYCVEPVPAAPLTDVNVSINGLETPPAPSPVGENFTVEIHLMNATATNVPTGVQGVEVHFYFGNILDYCKLIGFTDELGQPDGALKGPVIYVINGFYNDDYPTEDNAPLPPPYTSATQYVIAAATNDEPWNGNDGLVAKITFQITRQPSQNMIQPDFYASLQIAYGSLIDYELRFMPLSIVQGTLRIDSAPASLLAGDLNGDSKVDLGDLSILVLAYGATPSSPNWNPDADLNHDGVVNLIDLVTLAFYYGQHSP